MRACPLRDTAMNGLHCGSCKRACPLRDTAVNGLHCGSCKPPVLSGILQ